MEAGKVFDMTCREFWNSMPELAPRAAGDHGHIRECPACAARMERQRALDRGLAAVAGEWRGVEAPARLEHRLTEAFRSHNGVAVMPRRNVWAPALTWLAAAAALFALAVFLVRGRQPQPALRHTPGRVQLAYATPGFQEAAESSIYSEEGFIPLPNAARIEANEEVDLVRVELPRSSMIAAGYTVSPERLADPVQADVVLGADGLARAVRFLDEIE